jgi:hypothetical protein
MMIVESTSNFPSALKPTSPAPGRLLLTLLAVALLAPMLTAQSRSGSGRPARLGPGFGQGAALTARNQPYARRGFYLGDTPYFYDDYPFQGFAAGPASPQVILLQPHADTPPESKAEPLLIELRGDRYVRFGGVQKSTEHGIATSPEYAAEIPTESTVSAKPSPQTELAPAVLIYRDGHREEVSDYAIVGAVMYARGDYWQNGYWTKNIRLAALNISATMKANEDNGVKFTLPSSPNEVITRP